MKVYEIIGLIALLALVIVLPVYAFRENNRMDMAQQEVTGDQIDEAAVIYLQNCYQCHNIDGTGLGVMPALNDPAFAEFDETQLYNTIAHSPHGSAMASWHVEEGGILNSYQVQSLVTLIVTGDWDRVVAVAGEMGIEEPGAVLADIQSDMSALEPGESEDPHECRACHEEPEVHAERFGLNCARCHNLQAWKPALLTRHTFHIDHGNLIQVNCQTCHASNYAEFTCYGCHDHIEEDMVTVHEAENLTEWDDCSLCHPTGASGEARALQEAVTAPSN